MQYFDRVIDVRLESVEGKNKTFSYDKLMEEEFAIEFDVEFGKGASSTVKLYNVNAVTLDMCKPKLKPLQYPKVELTAGYRNNTALLASGNMKQFQIKKQGADTCLEIKFTDNKFLSEFNTILPGDSNSFSNQTVSNLIRSLLGKNRINSFEINLTDDPIIPQITFPGTLKQALDKLATLVKAKVYFRLGKLIVESDSARAKRTSQILYFDRTSGLIGTPEPKGIGYKVKTLLNPNIAPGEIIKLSFKDLGKEVKDKEFKVGKGKHSGGSRITSYFSEFEVKPV